MTDTDLHADVALVRMSDARLAELERIAAPFIADPAECEDRDERTYIAVLVALRAERATVRDQQVTIARLVEAGSDLADACAMACDGSLYDTPEDEEALAQVSNWRAALTRKEGER